jgi:CRP-like cAMP-binding protein
MIARLSARPACGTKGQPMATDSFIADRKLFRALEDKSQPIPCEKGCVLFSQGEEPKGIFILRSGQVALTMQSTSGQIVMRHRAFAGSVLGLPGVIASEPYSLNAIVSQGSEVRFVSRSDFEDLLRAEPSLYHDVLEILAAEVRAARQSLAARQHQHGR